MMRHSRETLVNAISHEIESWDEVPEQIAVPGQFLVDILDIIREQEPQETRLIRHSDMVLYCDECYGSIDEGPHTPMPKYCPWCGKKVKWDADGA